MRTLSYAANDVFGIRTMTVARKFQEKDQSRGSVPPVIPELPYGPNGWDRNGEHEPSHSGGNALIGMMLFIGADVMFFAALIGAFLVFRFGKVWPPPGQPRLPVEITGVNTVILLASAFTMLHAWRMIRNGHQHRLVSALTVTAILGATFLAVQGYEWAQLLGFGLTMSSSVYGATFYTLIGCHALHVFGALVWLFVVLKMAKQQRLSSQRFTSLQLCGMYWLLVVFLWPVLYTLVYIT